MAGISKEEFQKRVNAMADFGERLSALRDLFDHAPDKGDMDRQRLCCAIALRFVDEFVADMGYGERLTGPYVRMMLGLENISQGRTDPLFAPQRQNHPGIHSTVSLFRGHVAAVQDFLMPTHAKESAARFVVRHLGEENVDWLSDITGSRLSDNRWKTANRWRDDIPAKVRKNPTRAVSNSNNAIEGFRARRVALEATKDAATSIESLAIHHLKILARWIEDPFVRGQKSA